MRNPLKHPIFELKQKEYLFIYKIQKIVYIQSIFT